MRHKMKATQRNSGKAMGLSAEGSSIALPRRPSAMVSNTERTIKTNIISLDCRFIISCILNAILTGIRFTSITPCIEGYLHHIVAIIFFDLSILYLNPPQLSLPDREAEYQQTL